MAAKSKRILELDAPPRVCCSKPSSYFTSHWYSKISMGIPPRWVSNSPYGKYGVQLFFMLSGFVNAMTLLKKRQPRQLHCQPISSGFSFLLACDTAQRGFAIHIQYVRSTTDGGCIRGQHDGDCRDCLATIVGSP